MKTLEKELPWYVSLFEYCGHGLGLISNKMMHRWVVYFIYFIAIYIVLIGHGKRVLSAWNVDCRSRYGAMGTVVFILKREAFLLLFLFFMFIWFLTKLYELFYFEICYRKQHSTTAWDVYCRPRFRASCDFNIHILIKVLITIFILSSFVTKLLLNSGQRPTGMGM